MIIRSVTGAAERQETGEEPDREGEEPAGVPLTMEAIGEIHRRFQELLRLPQEWLVAPTFVVTAEVYYKDPSPPEPLLMNSFFLEDLGWASRLLQSGRLPQALRRYLQLGRPERVTDLLQERQQLESALSPERIPLAAWPHPGGISLNLLQQAAVNLALDETSAGNPVAVNGPPGTGKTTLLRDLIAAIIEERASRLASFQNPKDAFHHSGARLKAGQSWIHLYELDPALRGHEIVVASSNNKAVENISAEIPDIRAVCNNSLAYFRTLSDTLHERDTWGLVAAVLGNAVNRSRFREHFWWNEGSSLNSYLRSALGEKVLVEECGPDGKPVNRRPARIITAEQPPSSEEEALKRWESAKRRYLSQRERVSKCLAELSKLRDLRKKLPALRKELEDAGKQQQEAQLRLDECRSDLSRAKAAEEEASAQEREARSRLEEHSRLKPGWLERLLRTRKARLWSERQKGLEEELLERMLAGDECRRERQAAEARANEAKEAFAAATSLLGSAQAAVEEAERKLRTGAPDSAIWVDESLWELSHEDRHVRTPWIHRELQVERWKLFAAAMDLHRAFIDAAARPLRHNLAGLMLLWNRRLPAQHEANRLMEHLWSSLFLVVPVVSTTFASLGRMLGSLPEQSLGWLLIDEAGQAVPQAAVGGLLRCRRVVTVGDPAQLEPVVQLPDRLVGAICERYGVEASRWAGPEASVQTVMDEACRYQTVLESQTGSRKIGIPLLVHRRCAEPMFTISNRIAYADLMVYATNEAPSPAAGYLGESRWIHVEGAGTDKWCEAEGRAALRLLARLPSCAEPPGIYILSPFVIVAQGMRDLLLSAWRSLAALREMEEDEVRQWIWQRVGTLHTAQGRESEAVILVLGAPEPFQTGARGWAGGKPNLLNVAVTRARSAIYVIGNRDHWQQAGFFRELALRLPVARE